MPLLRACLLLRGLFRDAGKINNVLLTSIAYGYASSLLGDVFCAPPLSSTYTAKDINHTRAAAQYNAVQYIVHV